MLAKRENEAIDVFGVGFEPSQRICKALAASAIVPTMYQGNIPNCMIALDIANRLGMCVLSVMQKMYIVHGKPAFESTFTSAAVNACGRYTPLRAICNDLDGDDYGYYACATERETGEQLIGTTVDWHMVKKEGWDKKSGSKWLSLPEQMFKYRAQSFWVREYEPGITMGFPSTDEVDDVHANAHVVDVMPMPRTIDDAAKINNANVAKETSNG